jgi:hypothetical protein
VRAVHAHRSPEQSKAPWVSLPSPALTRQALSSTPKAQVLRFSASSEDVSSQREDRPTVRLRRPHPQLGQREAHRFGNGHRANFGVPSPGTSRVQRIRSLSRRHQRQLATRSTRLPKRARPVDSGRRASHIDRTRQSGRLKPLRPSACSSRVPRPTSKPQAAGAPSIGYARTPDDADHLVDAGAIAFVYSMADIALRLRGQATD